MHAPFPTKWGDSYNTNPGLKSGMNAFSAHCSIGEQFVGNGYNLKAKKKQARKNNRVFYKLKNIHWLPAENPTNAAY